jgi:hypothetical protein
MAACKKLRADVLIFSFLGGNNQEAVYQNGKKYAQNKNKYT